MAFFMSFLCATFLELLFVCIVNGQSLVPALMIFGDSVVDVGNNNDLYTLVKANFPPYGRDFISNIPTGRFCNGKLATDFTAENIGFSSYPPAYLSRQASGKNLLIGANFASAGSGYYDRTSQLYRSISLTQQLDLYKEYRSKVVKVARRFNANATSIITEAIYILSSGSSDYVQNYYINPFLYKAYNTDQFSDMLIQSFSSFVQGLYELGARRIGVTSLPPLGCLPASITLFGGGRNDCVERLNNDSMMFNKKINNAVIDLQGDFTGLKIVVFDIYTPLYDLVKNPDKNGFFETRRGCCGTGTIETSLLCNEKSPGTCSNADKYVFWDSFHPTEAANKKLAEALLAQGISLIS